MTPRRCNRCGYAGRAGLMRQRGQTWHVRCAEVRGGVVVFPSSGQMVRAKEKR